MVTRRRAAPLVLVAVLALFAAHPASAGAATFEVNTVSDNQDLNGNIGAAGPFDGLCDIDAGTIGEQCSLRAALAEADAGASDLDLIRFDQTAMLGQTITVLSTFPALNDPVDVNGCLNAAEAGNPNSPEPCVGLTRSGSDPGIGIGINFNSGGAGRDTVIRGLAFTNWALAIRYSDLGQVGGSLNLQNNWFGTGVDDAPGRERRRGFAAGRQRHRRRLGERHGADRAQCVLQQQLRGARDRGRRRQQGPGQLLRDHGHRRGRAGGNAENIAVVHQTTSPGYPDPDDLPENTLIGGTVTAGEAATAACDGVCNVIANASGIAANGAGNGIDLQGEAINSELPPGPRPSRETSSGSTPRGQPPSGTPSTASASARRTA